MFLPNAAGNTAAWRFATEKARVKAKRIYPQFHRANGPIPYVLFGLFRRVLFYATLIREDDHEFSRNKFAYCKPIPFNQFAVYTHNVV